MQLPHPREQRLGILFVVRYLERGVLADELLERCAKRQLVRRLLQLKRRDEDWLRCGHSFEDDGLAAPRAQRDAGGAKGFACHVASSGAGGTATRTGRARRLPLRRLALLLLPPLPPPLPTRRRGDERVAGPSVLQSDNADNLTAVHGIDVLQIAREDLNQARGALRLRACCVQ